MYIQSSKLLQPVNRIMKFNSCAFIAEDGPNITGKLSIKGVEIPYDSQLITRLTLNPKAVNQPVLFGFLGTKVTFLLLKFIYDETNPLCTDQEVEYYYADQPTVTRYAHKLLLLTGNSVHRIPQIYLNNPTESKIIVEAFLASMEESLLELGDVSVVYITNLYYNSIISDIGWSQIHLASGSTQLQIVGENNYTELYLDYTDILSIESTNSTFDLTITTTSDTIIMLRFVNLFEMYQARSRINWVTRIPTERYLTIDYPTADLESPVFLLNPLTPVDTNTYVYPFIGFTVLVEDILLYFISGVTDNRDGVITSDSINIIVREVGTTVPVTGITHIGIYDVVMTVVDLANNMTMLDYTLIADNVPPIILFNYDTGFTMTPSDMLYPSSGISMSDIINKSVINVYDVIDGIIPNSNIIVTISGYTGLTYITDPGEYIVNYYVEDRAGNSVTYDKILTYSGYKIITDGETVIVPSGVTSYELNIVGGSGTTVNVVLSGETFILAVLSGATSGSTDDELVWDLGGLGEYNFGSGTTGSISVTVNGTLFNLVFTRGSLLLKIIKE